MIHNIDPPLSQWNVGRSVRVSNTNATHILFANQGDSRGPKIEIVDEEVKIPDYLLQTGKTLVVYLMLNGVTLESKAFPVAKQPRPEDYVYTETEVLTWESLDKRIKRLEENGSGGGTSGSKRLVVTLTGAIWKGEDLESSHTATQIHNHVKSGGNVVVWWKDYNTYMALDNVDEYEATVYMHRFSDGSVVSLLIENSNPVMWSLVEHALKSDIPSVEDIIAALPVYKGEVEPV